MRYTSTRDPSVAASFSQALALGLAPDGGLYVPAEWPALELAELAGARDLAELAARFLAPFAAGDALARELPAICREALAAARAAGALGASISGAGPTLFAWARERDAAAVGRALAAALVGHGHEVDSWIVGLDSAGARVVASA